MMGMVGFRPEDGELAYSMDQWPGYADERMRLVKFLEERRVLNPVVLTGDIHSNWVNDLRVDDRKTETSVVATEFVGTSITSGGDGKAEVPGVQDRLADNPCVRFFNAQRGYVRCTVTPKAWRSDYQVVEKVTETGAPIVTKASFVVEAGRPAPSPPESPSLYATSHRPGASIRTMRGRGRPMSPRGRSRTRLDRPGGDLLP